MSNLTAYILLCVLTVIAFASATAVSVYHWYIFPSEQIGHWMIAFAALLGVVITTWKGMYRENGTPPC